MKRYSVNDSCVEDPMIESVSGEYIAYSEVAKIKADAIREAVRHSISIYTAVTGVHGKTIDSLLDYANKLERGE